MSVTLRITTFTGLIVTYLQLQITVIWLSNVVVPCMCYDLQWRRLNVEKIKIRTPKLQAKTSRVCTVVRTILHALLIIICKKRSTN